MVKLPLRLMTCRRAALEAGSQIHGPRCCRQQLGITALYGTVAMVLVAALVCLPLTVWTTAVIKHCMCNHHFPSHATQIPVATQYLGLNLEPCVCMHRARTVSLDCTGTSCIS